MPFIEKSSYKKPPLHQINGHFQTILPSLFRKIEGINYTRERIELWDSDFLDLDWMTNGSRKLAIVSHGLEGHSDRHYVKGMVKSFSNAGWDTLAWNCRSCSGEMNKLPRMYHHGATDDMEAVINHVVKTRDYETIVMTGFSMGGGMTLKYLGENGSNIPDEIKAAAVFSVPVNLHASIPTIHEWQNAFYKIRFLRKLKRKLRAKAAMYPELISLEGLDDINDFYEFDDRYSAPLHGFKDSEDFYSKISAHQFIPEIKIPTLIVNAKNDPLLPEACYPVTLAKEHPYIYLEIPRVGGHVGFAIPGEELSYADRRALEFVENLEL
ncbi:MAG: alpha/beta fold hydrolase [Bacteroidota bacterium]